MRRAKGWTGETGLLDPYWTLALPLLALGAVIATPPEQRLTWTLGGAALFALMQWLVPKCRFRKYQYFSPVNVALGLLLVKLVAAPILVMAVGAEQEVLWAIPSREAMEGALQIDMVSYVALCAGLAFAPDRLKRVKTGSLLGGLSQPPSATIVAIFAAVGLVGFVLAFGSLGRILEYFLRPSSGLEINAENEASWNGFLGIVLRPFLAFSLVAWWARFADDASGSSKNAWKPTLAGLVAAAGITIANLTFSFNRAAFFFPLVALVAVYSARIRRIPFAIVAGSLAVSIPFWMAVGDYRSSSTTESVAGAAGFTLQKFADQVFGYTIGPQFTGLYYEQTGWGEQLGGGTVTISSALSPIPILGKGFREANGPTLFNDAIRSVPEVFDQIVPFSTELFMDFHLVGVMAGFFGLGILLSRVGMLLGAAESTFGAFSLQYISIWLAMLSVWSISIVSQVLFYFFAPVYVYVAAMRARAWLRGMSRPALSRQTSTIHVSTNQGGTAG